MKLSLDRDQALEIKRVEEKNLEDLEQWGADLEDEAGAGDAAGLLAWAASKVYRADDLERWRARIIEVVEQQSEDPGLWFVAASASEAYLQRALRLLHAAIEDDPRDAIVRLFREK